MRKGQRLSSQHLLRLNIHVQFSTPQLHADSPLPQIQQFQQFQRLFYEW
jgi:hypothetical protein